MNKLLQVFALLSLVLNLVACEDMNKNESEEILSVKSTANYVEIIKDKKTGCEYIAKDGIVPRLNADGKTVRGCDNQKKN